ncbi:hypothetical protein FKP32DRAFT_1599170 [Trametes sanguinea]|nr:hypothetical protein FKP32DRAFT_1599170 [Trametes sanguinea]
MRPTDIRRSEMPGPKVYNLWWGDRGVQKQKGIVTYSLSPFRQRAAHKMITNWVFNGYRRLSSQAVYWVIPFAMGKSQCLRPSYPWHHALRRYCIPKLPRFSTQSCRVSVLETSPSHTLPLL